MGLCSPTKAFCWADGFGLIFRMIKVMIKISGLGQIDSANTSTKCIHLRIINEK